MMRAGRLTDDHVSKVVKSADPAPQLDELVLRVRACGTCGSDVTDDRKLLVVL